MRTSGMALLRAAQLFSSAAPAFRKTTSYGPGVRDWNKHWNKPSGSIATLNRHDGKPHRHAREIARRLRQSELVA